MARIRTTNRLYFEAIVYALPREKFGGLGSSAPLALESVGPNPTDRGKNGTKRNILVDENGVPLSLVVTGANRHDSVALDAALYGLGPPTDHAGTGARGPGRGRSQVNQDARRPGGGYGDMDPTDGPA